VLYVFGVTSNLKKKRIYEHKEDLIDGFTKKYNVDKLVYFETTNREWKINLIEKENPC
jgi:putative endonuclease